MNPVPRLLEGFAVLVVDDEPDNLDVAARVLRKSGAKVIAAEDGSHALELAQTHLPDFILADLSMPEVDGWMLLRQILDNPTTKDIPVVALTAHAMPGDRERGLEAGFAGYITKPLRVDAFVEDLLISLPALRQRMNFPSNS